MLLSREDAELFFKLHSSLMQFVLERTQGAGGPAPMEAYSSLPAEQRQEVVKVFLGRLDLIDAFIAGNPVRLSEEELGIVSSWRHLVSGRFIALRQLKKHMVFLSCEGKSTAYGVVGLVDPIEQVIPQPLPAFIETVLLPFRGQIIYDGMVGLFNVTFGPGSRHGFEESLRTAKANSRFVTSLPWEAPVSKLIWTLQDSNGFMIDIRQQPVAMQRAAFKQGLIPYVPADRAAAAVQERIPASPSRRLLA